MPGTLETLLASARKEWIHWGRSTWNLTTKVVRIGHRDDDPVFAQYVIDNYNSVGGGSPSVSDIQNDLYPWSAVGISAIFKQAGFGKTELPFSQAHSKWIKPSVAARQTGAPALYHAFRLNEPEATPDLGDLVGYTYAKVSFVKAQAYFDKTGSYKSHTDIVVARRAQEIDVIGCNVRDSVTIKTIPLTPSGHIADRDHKWFVVLRRKGF